MTKNDLREFRKMREKHIRHKDGGVPVSDVPRYAELSENVVDFMENLEGLERIVAELYYLRAKTSVYISAETFYSVRQIERIVKKVTDRLTS